MKGKKATKRALLSSALSLVLCFSMLLGTTFAWFTDTATTSVNTIQSGKLDVALEDEAGNSLEGKELSFVNKDGSADILWEPGVTFRTEKFKVANNGNLDLKYQIVVNGINVSDNKLMEVIDFKIVDADATTDAANPVKVDFNKETDYTLLAETDSAWMYIEAHMDEKAGNEYQDLTCSGISIVVYATQMASEYDSNGNTYDKDAEYEKAIIVKTADEFVEAFNNLKAGDSIALAADIDMTGKSLNEVSGNKGFSLNGNGYTISNLKTTDASALFVDHSGSSAYFFRNLTLKDCSVTSADNYGALFVGDGDTSSGLYFNNCHVVNCTVTSEKYAAGFVGYNSGYGNDNNGPVYGHDNIIDCSITGSTITGKGSAGLAIAHAGGNKATYNVISNFTALGNTINGEDGVHTGLIVGTAGVGVTEIKGATLTANTGNMNTVAVADTNGNETTGVVGRFVPNDTGKLYVSDVTIKTGTYVSKNVSTPAELTAAINSGDIVDVELAAGTYTLPTTTNKEVTISGTKDTVIDLSNGTGQMHNMDFVFDGVTIKGAEGLYKGIIHSSSVAYKNCTLTGLQFLYAGTVTFENCKFDSIGAEHCIWTYGAKNISFTGCDFTYGDRCVNVYLDNGTGSQNVSFTDCTFATTNTASKGAVEINSSVFPLGVTVSFVDCTAPAYGTMVGISGWDGTNGATANVTVDGVKVTPDQWAK